MKSWQSPTSEGTEQSVSTTPNASFGPSNQWLQEEIGCSSSSPGPEAPLDAASSLAALSQLQEERERLTARQAVVEQDIATFTDLLAVMTEEHTAAGQQLADLQARLEAATQAAAEPGSERSFLTGPAEQQELDALQQSLGEEGLRAAELGGNVQRIEHLITDRSQEAAAIQEALAANQHHEQLIRAQRAGVIETAEVLDTTRDIQYRNDFGIDDEEHIYERGAGTSTPDLGIQENLEGYWSNSETQIDHTTDKDFENCCIYVLHTLEEAGYDLDALVTINNQEVTVRRLVLIHAPTLLAGYSGSLAAVAVDPTHRYNAVLRGVVTALTASGQGGEVSSVHDLRPGDLLQWWTRSSSGHTTIIHQVRTTTGTLSSASDPADPALQAGLAVESVAVLGSHETHRSLQEGQQRRGEDTDTSEAGQDLYGRQDHVYVTDFITLRDDHTGTIPYFDGGKADIVQWWAVRPAGSPWRSPGR